MRSPHHLGYDKHERTGGVAGGNARNGTRSKTVLTKAGPVEIDVPRDRAGSFEPMVVRKRQRRLGVDRGHRVVAVGAGHHARGHRCAFGRRVRRGGVQATISTITDKVLDGMAEWQNRPLDPVYPVLFIDCYPRQGA